MSKRKRRRAGAKPAALPATIKPKARSAAAAPVCDAEPGTLPTIDAAAEKLAPFFETNPYSTIDRSGENPAWLQISKPWGDPSVAFIIEEGFDRLAETLNGVVLPERLSGIWHRDTRKLEIIWTTYRLPAIWEEVFGRKFTFEHRGSRHSCEFALTSDRVMILAEHFRAVGVSETGHRNMPSFRSMAVFRAAKQEAAHLDKPRSFWIDNIDWDEGLTLDLITHLNFFMRYFDGLTPVVLVHAGQTEPQIPKRTRYIRNKFPSVIVSSELDENLLSFWSFAEDGNAMLRFLLYYRILEYAAVHFIDNAIRDDLRKLLLAPDLRANLSQSVEQMVGVMSATKLSDAQRLQGLMRKGVDSALVWRDIKANIGFFSKDTDFDGGFSIRAIVGANDTEATFQARGLENLADALRKIRNALSHGRDQETKGVIRPTRKNFELFRPWVHLIATAAGEVVLYKDAT